MKNRKPPKGIGGFRCVKLCSLWLSERANIGVFWIGLRGFPLKKMGMGKMCFEMLLRGVFFHGALPHRESDGLTKGRHAPLADRRKD